MIIPFFLQCRDPFSGDCDARQTRRTWVSSFFCLAVPRPVFRGLRRLEKLEQPLLILAGLQCRDPFSGDCDARAPGASPQPRKTLAVPRPVFRGLRPPQDQEAFVGRGAQCLAVPRPVFRGLRRDLQIKHPARVKGLLQCRDPFSGDCDKASSWPIVRP